MLPDAVGMPRRDITPAWHEAPPSVAADAAYHGGMTAEPERDPKKAERGTPAISRVCADGTIIELVYDREQRRTGLVASRFDGLWNIEQQVRTDTGEILTPYSPRNNLIANECVMLPSQPEPFGDQADLLASIEAFLNRYVGLSPLFLRMASHYVLLSWVHDRFNELPYLRLRGEYGTGKTRGLIVLGSLCYRGFFASGASTVSPIFHTLDAFGGTLMLDEADFRFSDSKSELVKILNNGNVRGLPVLRTIVNRNREFDPYAFKVFGPKIIAMRGSFEDKALESRFLTEEMGQRPLRQDIPISLPDSFYEEALHLRNQLLMFRLTQLFRVGADTSVLIPGVEPRINQVALSLLSIVSDPAIRREIGDALIGQHDRVRAERSQTAEAGVLKALRAAFMETSGVTVSYQEIADRFNEAQGARYGKPVTSRWIGNVLRQHLHIATYKSRGVYVVPLAERPKIDELVKRFGITDEFAAR